MVSDLLTFGHWKVVFSLFLILHRAFSHFMYLMFCQFRKRKMAQSQFQKLFWNQDSDVVGNLVVEIEIFNFCLFVCTSRFANFARGKWSNHNSKNWSEIRTATSFWIWLWNFQFETFIFFTTLYLTYHSNAIFSFYDPSGKLPNRKDVIWKLYHHIYSVNYCVPLPENFPNIFDGVCRVRTHVRRIAWLRWRQRAALSSR